MVDALALEVDEGRDKLRKATGRSKYLLIRGYPNRETVRGNPSESLRKVRAVRPLDSALKTTLGSETS